MEPIEAQDALLVAFLSERVQKHMLEAENARKTQEAAIAQAERAQAELAARFREIRLKYNMSENDKIDYDTTNGVYQIVRQ